MAKKQHKTDIVIRFGALHNEVTISRGHGSSRSAITMDIHGHGKEVLRQQARKIVHNAFMCNKRNRDFSFGRAIVDYRAVFNGSN